MAKRTTKVLLIDDDKLFFALVKRYLDQAPDARYHVDWCPLADEGLAALERQEHDVYLVDCNLDGGNGLDIVRMAAAESCRRPMIVITSMGDHELDQAAMDAGAADYLAKERINAFTLNHSIGYALTTWRLTEKLRSRAEQQDKLADRLYKQTSKLDSILAHVPDQLYLFDLDGRFERVDNSHRMTAGEDADFDLNSLLVKGNLEGTQFRSDLHAVLINGGDRVDEIQTTKAKVSAQNFEYKLSEVRDNLGTITGAVCSIRNITGRKRASQVIKKSERRFKAAAEASLDAFAVLKVCRTQEDEVYDFAVVEANSRLINLLGIQRRELLGSRLSNLLTGPQWDILFPLYHRVFHTAKAQQGEFEVGEFIDVNWVHHQAVGLEDGVAVTLSDISGRRQVEGELKLSQERLDLAISAADIGLWDWQVERQQIHMSQIMADMLGKEQGFLRIRRFVSLIHPQDRGAAFTRFRYQVEHKSGLFDVEFRIKMRAGYRWVLLRGKVTEVVRGGGFKRAIGTLMDVHDKRLSQEELTRRALYDSLTGLGNRNFFLDHLGQAREDVERGHMNGMALLFMDLDSFKHINDSMGHSAGDELLKLVAQRLDSCMRENEMVARFGGDEFAIMVKNVATSDAALQAADRVHLAMQDPICLGDKQIVISTSIGVVHHHATGQASDDMLRDVDVAMYSAKDSGPGQTALFTDQMKEDADLFLEMQGEIRRALDNEELCLYFQPIVDMADGCMKGAEALVRWIKPSGELVSPGQFLPVAMRAGLMGRIDDWVLATACKHLGAWLDAGLLSDRFKLNVNASGDQIVNARFPDQLAEILGKTGVSPERLVIELTESTLIENAFAAKMSLGRVSGMGVSIALDDFGTGFSSLSHLNSFPLDVIKIDRSFVIDMTEDEKGAKIVQGVIRLARTLGLKVTAEGIEDTNQMNMLMDMGCDYCQGFYFSRPLCEQDMLELISSDYRWPIKFSAVKASVSSIRPVHS